MPSPGRGHILLRRGTRGEGLSANFRGGQLMARRAERRFAAPVLSAAAGAPPALEVAGPHTGLTVCARCRFRLLVPDRVGIGSPAPPLISWSLNALNSLHHPQVHISPY